MGIGRIMAKAFNCVTKSAKSTVTQNAGKVLNAGAKNTAPSVFSKVETNTANRILHMQDAKAAFTPYATKVTKTNVPTQQYLDEMLDVAKVDGLKTEGIYNRAAAADALAAFKNEPLPPQVVKGAKLGVTSVPTQQYLDDLNNIAKIDALKTYECGGRGTLSILKQREAAREAFTNGDKVISRWKLDYLKSLNDDLKQLEDYLKPYGKITGAKKPMKFANASMDEYFSKPAFAKFREALHKNIKDAL